MPAEHLSSARGGGEADAPAPFILAFGDSLTAGYGLAMHEAFAARLEAALRRRWQSARVHNAGVSGDTSAHARARLPRLLSSLDRLPDLAIVEFGANDLIRGVPLARTRANLDAVLHGLAQCGIPVLLAALEAPRFMGPIAAACDRLYAELAATHAVPMVPFFPAGVMGHPDLVLRDRLHPNGTAIEMVVDAMLPAVIDALAPAVASAA